MEPWVGGILSSGTIPTFLVQSMRFLFSEIHSFNIKV